MDERLSQLERISRKIVQVIGALREENRKLALRIAHLEAIIREDIAFQREVLKTLEGILEEIESIEGEIDGGKED